MSARAVNFMCEFLFLFTFFLRDDFVFSLFCFFCALARAVVSVITLFFLSTMCVCVCVCVCVNVCVSVCMCVCVMCLFVCSFVSFN